MKAAFEINGLEWYKYNRYNVSYIDVNQNTITIKQTYMDNNMTMDVEGIEFLLRMLFIELLQGNLFRWRYY